MLRFEDIMNFFPVTSKLASHHDAQRSISVTRTIARCTRLRDIAVHVEGAYLAYRYRFEVNAIADRQPAVNCRCASCCIRRDLKDDASFLYITNVQRM